jgi:hypothetical protein
MSTESNQPHASAGLGFLSQERDNSWDCITVEDWDHDLAMPTNDSFCFLEVEQSNGMNELGLVSTDPFLFGNSMDWVSFNSMPLMLSEFPS